jgi:hypothetical protein
MPIDFNSAPEQRSGELIPEGTVAPVHLTLRPGNSGDGGWLRRSKDGGAFMLDCEFTVIEGPHAKRKFWALYIVNGTTEGHQKAAEISTSRLRAILESVRGVRPDDDTPKARLARQLQDGYGELDGMRFVAKIGVELGKDGFRDKNTLAEVITPDKRVWAKLEQPIRGRASNDSGLRSQSFEKVDRLNNAPTTNKPSWA